MRILLTTDLIGGVWRYTMTLVQELVQRGHTCAVAVIGAPGDEHLAELPAGVELVSRDLRLEWMPGAGPDLEEGRNGCRPGPRWQADLVHLNHFAYAVGDYDARSWWWPTRTCGPGSWMCVGGCAGGVG
jgi:hypothetical protein